ncbi:hypothetical protein QTP88_007488 [Uroleucon formosanum]
MLNCGKLQKLVHNNHEPRLLDQVWKITIARIKVFDSNYRSDPGELLPVTDKEFSPAKVAFSRNNHSVFFLRLYCYNNENLYIGAIDYTALPRKVHCGIVYNKVMLSPPLFSVFERLLFRRLVSFSRHSGAARRLVLFTRAGGGLFP